ncbi:MAG: hypothetical protein ACE367_20325 [Acidimicrobiales bacterium]
MPLPAAGDPGPDRAARQGEAATDEPTDSDPADTPDGAPADDPADRPRPVPAANDPDGDEPDRTDPDDEAEATPTPPPPPPAPLAGVPAGPEPGIDAELGEALDRTGLLGAWYLLAPTETGLALVAVEGAAAETGRTVMLETLDRFAGTIDLIASLRLARQVTGARAHRTAESIVEVDAQLSVLATSIAASEIRLGVLGDDLAAVITAIREAAIGMYTNGSQGPVSAMGDVAAYNEHAELIVQVDATFDELGSMRRGLEAAIAAEQAVLRSLLDERRAAEARRADLREQLDDLNDAIDSLNTRLRATRDDRNAQLAAMPAAMAAAHDARALGTPSAVPFPLVNLDAYVRAQNDVADFYPTCAVPWYLLGGIARIESAHATFGGATVGPDGDVSQRILGPLLDGSLEGTMVITDTDGGALDGNAEFDAAVGPFQFIPGTWSRHALDSTGDGFADPHNLYDGALSAAGYLCASSDVRTDADIERSVLSYNRSRVYLANVTSAARTYATALAVPDPDLEGIVGKGPEGWRDEDWDRHVWRRDTEAVTTWLVDTWLRNARRDNREPSVAAPGDGSDPTATEEPPPLLLPFAGEGDVETRTDPERVEPTIDGD